ncbi:hypothetical protein GCM10010441_73750 [Kitasatospora paracochleata]|uniref:DUF4071 domain-containing protein n=1 Tax=Kitasatospora paracochleata TaxID=58354 RepID=A0ABT1J5I5_9ACTN|nr:hypothetical protein [Kitasatospora paracochleata]MCP2312700.1 hypothetical protein [Kitasatospora paracochleata]
MSECFVIMPIRRDGSEEFFHFRTIYDDYVKPTVIQSGFDKVIRADDVQKSGAITQDIVQRLATADLVVADLTDLNPNVYYELGVRHSLKGRGTIMILDEGRTPDIPFDLSAYRVIKFKSDLQGISKLRHGLARYLEELGAKSPDSEERDNPVHNWLPSLPVNALSTAVGSEEGRLRQSLAELNKQLQGYKQRYGEPESGSSGDEDVTHQVFTLLQQARDGALGPDLVKAAHEAAERQDKTGYLEALYRIQGSELRLSEREYVILAMDALQLSLPEAQAMVLQAGTIAHPADKSLKRAQLSQLAHSYDPSERRKARGALQAEIGIRSQDGRIIVPARLDGETASLLGIMLDAYHADNMDKEALEITSALIEKLPSSSALARNHARALEKAGEDPVEWYQRSIWCANPDDTSAIWFGNELHNTRRYVDALEAYSFACVLDANDATNFAHVADEISRTIDERDYPVGQAAMKRILPQEVRIETLKTTLVAAFSCDQLGQSDVDRSIEAVKRSAIDSGFVNAILQIRTEGSAELDGEVVWRMRPGERRAFAIRLYDLVKSPLTVREDFTNSPDGET